MFLKREKCKNYVFKKKNQKLVIFKIEKKWKLIAYYASAYPF